MSQPTTREVIADLHIMRGQLGHEGLRWMFPKLDAAISKLEALADAEDARPEQPEAIPPLPPGWEMSIPIDGPITAVSDMGQDYAWVGGAWELIHTPLMLVTRSEFEALVSRVEACEGRK